MWRTSPNQCSRKLAKSSGIRLYTLPAAGSMMLSSHEDEFGSMVDQRCFEREYRVPEGNEGIVERFYRELWNNWDLNVADEILAEDLRFRGTLGSTLEGREAF